MNNFKPDLTFGEYHQDKIYSILNMSKSSAEVKTERYNTWSRRDNLCIEVECSGKPSGIYHPDNKNVKWWIQNFCSPDDKNYYGTFIFPIERIKKLAEKYKDKYVMVGDYKSSKLILIPIAEAFTTKNLED